VAGGAGCRDDISQTPLAFSSDQRGPTAQPADLDLATIPFSLLFFALLCVTPSHITKLNPQLFTVWELIPGLGPNLPCTTRPPGNAPLETS
jgi:hypothetical protein